MKYTFMVGYCKLCRQKEIEQYGTLVGHNPYKPDKRHIKACKEAGCLHPTYYARSSGSPMTPEGRNEQES